MDMLDMIQLEFPFTRQGALERYNSDQVDFFKAKYAQYYLDTDNPHYLKPFEEWVGENVQELAKYFSKNFSHLYFANTVESDNDTVWDAWVDNKLHDNHTIYINLEDKLNND